MNEQQRQSLKQQPMSKRGCAPVHQFYMVEFRQLGIGTPLYLKTRDELNERIEWCLATETPFHVGHAFRATLTDGNNQDEKL